MNGVVHSDEEESSARLERIRVPAEKQHGDVVVPVKEDEGPLANDDEVRVDELEGLGEDEELNPQSSGEGTPRSLGALADVLGKGERIQSVEEEGNGPHRAHSGEDGKEQIPRGQEVAVNISVRLASLEELLPAEAQDHVHYANDGGVEGPSLKH